MEEASQAKAHLSQLQHLQHAQADIPAACAEQPLKLSIL